MRAHGRRMLGLVAAATVALGALVGAGTAAGAAEDPGDIGFGVAPTAGIQFGDVPLAHSSEEQRFDVTVPDGWTLNGVVTQAGQGNLDDFQLDIPSFRACAEQAGPTSCTIGYAFVPSRQGAASATAVFEFLQNGTSDVYQRISRPLSGTGIAPGPGVSGFSVSPSTVDFGDQPVGAPSAPKTVTVIIPAGWSLADFGVGDGDVGDFDADITQVQACGATPGPTQCAIGVTFTPGGTGSRSAKATLDIGLTPGGGGEESKTITLKGKGVSPGIGGPDFTAAPTSLDFGEVPVQASEKQFVTLTVPEGYELVGAGVAGGQDEDFAIDDQTFEECFHLAGPVSCQVGLVFTPDGNGRRTTQANFSVAPIGGGDAAHAFVQLSGTGGGLTAPGPEGPPATPPAQLAPAPAQPAAALAAAPRFTG